MCHYDDEGDLPPSEVANLSDEAQSKLVALVQLGDALRETISAEIDSLTNNATNTDPFAAMWGRIEHKVSTNGVASKAAREEPAAEPSPGLLDQIGEWLNRYRSQMFTGAIAAVAAAAIVWFVRPPEKTVEYVEVSNNARAARTVPVSLESHVAEVESLEVYDGSGVVLTIQSDDDEAPTTVIWLTLPENSVEGPI